MRIETRLQELGLVLPEPLNRTYPFAWVRVRGNRAYISGHLPLAPDGQVAEPRGKVGADLTLDEGKQAARLAALAMFGSLQRELGNLDRVKAWLRVFGMVNVAPGFTEIPEVVNGFSDLLLEVFGREVGKHSRSAVGMAELPFGVPVEFEAEVEIDGGDASR